MRVAIYARVSTDGQTVENQVRDLKRWAKKAGHEIVAVLTDKGVSGAKGRENRKALDDLLKAAVRRDFDLVAAWSVDRLGRSLKGLLGLLEELESAGVDLSSTSKLSTQPRLRAAPSSRCWASSLSLSEP